MAKDKTVNVRVLSRPGNLVLYEMMEDLINEHHPHLVEAKISIAWHMGWNTDLDGKLRLGQAKKCSDLDRDMHGQDFVILLNQAVFQSVTFSKEQKRALLDHELCHCERQTDEHGDPKLDERGRYCWRIRKHDVEEFQAIVDRHGAWKQDVEEFARAALEKAAAPLFEGED